ncbi:GNAT family N-acetyltransferase [Lentibacillus sediminis]|uniref:GNAT family N-acetyltransferase n=1 Tax=Lentibacillus sediminis TaxID=1940529 RepID=UPI000C1BF7BD|nr:GNAT family N-acetyltransferase [Lentibacillus sediminis]
MLHYRTIDVAKDRDTVVPFRRDSFAVSFGDDSGFDGASYTDWLEEKISKFPDGFVLLMEDNQPVGQLELSIREYQGRTIGYVHLYYLIKSKRGSGYGKELQRYALKFFRGQGVKEYHLRVAPDNVNARKFYRRNGMEEVGSELDGKVIRLQGCVE